MPRKPGQSFQTAYKCHNLFRWPTLMSGFFVILLYAAVTLTVEAAPIATASEPGHNISRRLLQVGLGASASILCGSANNSNIRFYDVYEDQFIQQTNVENDSIRPYAVLVLHNIQKPSIYRCLYNNTVISETYITTDSSSAVRLEMGIGDTAALTCTHQNSDVHFYKETQERKGSPIRHGHIWPLSSDIVSIDNNTSILLLRNASEQKSTYRCMNKDKAIDESKVYVGTPPLPITNFTCQGYNYENMSCKFPIPQNNILTTYSLVYSPDKEILGDHHSCPLQIIGNMMYFILALPPASPCMYMPIRATYTFRLTAENILGNLSNTFVVNNRQVVIPAKLDVNITAASADSVNLSWKNINGVYYKLGLLYDIRITPDGLEEYAVPSSCATYNCNVLLTQLPYPYCRYTLTVRARANIAGSNWSEPFIGSFLTASRAPDHAPETSVGSFYIDPNEEKISLYWKQLSRYEENGPEFHYIIQELDLDGKVFDTMNTTETSVVFPWRRLPRVYEVRSSNALNVSQFASKIRAYPAKKGVAYTPERVERLSNNGVFILSWKRPGAFHTQPPSNYTVFWCQQLHVSANQCKGTIHFQHLDSMQMNFTTDSNNNTLIMAVAANYPDWSSGMHWPVCSATLKTELMQMTSEANPMTATEIALRWNTGNTCIAVLKGFNITYCQVADKLQSACISKPSTITINEPETKQFHITNLQPYSWYRITMLMFSESKRSPSSDAIYCRTKDAAPESPRRLRVDIASVTSNSANISWFAPTITNGILQKYTVWLRTRNHTERVEIPVHNITDLDDPNAPITFTLTGLSSYSKYEVYVTANTSEISQPSATVEFTTLIGRPTKPQKVRTIRDGGSLILEWTDPEMASGRVELYEVAIVRVLTNVTGGNSNDENVLQKRMVTFVKSGLSESSHRCRLKTPDCSGATYSYSLQVRAINLVTENELDNTTFHIEGGTVQRRRRYSSPVISGAVPSQATANAGRYNSEAAKLNTQRDLHVISVSSIVGDANGGSNLPPTFMDDLRGGSSVIAYEYRGEFECDMLNENVAGSMRAVGGGKYYRLDSPWESSKENYICDVFSWQIFASILCFVGMFIALVYWIYQYYRRGNNIGFEFPNGLLNQLDGIGKVPESVVAHGYDNRLEKTLPEVSNKFDCFQTKEKTRLLNFGSAFHSLTPSSSESGVPEADNVSRSSGTSREDVHEELAQFNPRREQAYSDSTTSLDEPTDALREQSHMENKGQQQFKTISTPPNDSVAVNDGYLRVAEMMLGVQPKISVTTDQSDSANSSNSAEDSAYLHLQSVARAKPLNRSDLQCSKSVNHNDASSVAKTCNPASLPVVSEPSSGIANHTLAVAGPAIATTAATAANAGTYLPSGLLIAETASANSVMPSNFQLVAGNYVLPDTVARLTSLQTAIKPEQQQLRSSQHQQQQQTPTSVGYVTLDALGKVASLPIKPTTTAAHENKLANPFNANVDSNATTAISRNNSTIGRSQGSDNNYGDNNNKGDVICGYVSQRQLAEFGHLKIQ